MQLAGHLRGRASQEWNLISTADKSTYAVAVETLRERLDPVNRVVVAQDFRHATQGESESVEDFMCRLERLFQIAYGRDGLNADARETLLYGQLQDGLKYELIRSSTVSGAQSYQQLCLCAKAEEKRLVGLKKRQTYHRDNQKRLERERPPHTSYKQETAVVGPRPNRSKQERRCYTCNAVGHLARECTQTKRESAAKGNKATPGARTKVVKTTPIGNPRDLLYSSESEGEVR